jgi:predicted DNA-binding ribbon-helix-helix protein
MPGKRVQLDDETWQALDLLARDRMMDFQELADEAFRDLLRKHGRPTDLKSALRLSSGQSASVHKLPPTKEQVGGDEPASRAPAARGRRAGRRSTTTK